MRRGGEDAGPELTTESTDKTALNPVIPDDNKRIIRAHEPTCSPNPVARAGTWTVLSRADNDARRNERDAARHRLSNPPPP